MASATTSKSSSNRCPYWFSVIAASLCPSCRWIVFTCAPEEIISEATVTPLTGPSDSDVLAALDTEYSMSPDVIAQSVPGLTKADAPARLEALAADGLAIIDSRGRYTRKDPA